MSGLQTRTYTLAGSSLTAGTFTSISQLLGSSQSTTCLLYTSPSPRDGLLSRMPSSA